MTSAVIEKDGQVDIRGLLMGADTPYTILRDDAPNWWDMAEIRSSDLSMPGRSGILAGDDLYDGLPITWKVEIEGTGLVLQNRIDALKAAFAASDTTVDMYLQMLGTQRVRLIRPRRCAVAANNLAAGSAVATVQVVAVDPFAYGADEQSESATLVSLGDGLVFPATFPATFGIVDGGAGTFNAVNDGNKSAPWTATITGPITDPVIENTTAGVSFGLTGEIEAGDFIELDSRSKTILLNGTGNASSMRAAGVQWFDLAPGNNAIAFSAGGEPPYGELTMTWRSTWL